LTNPPTLGRFAIEVARGRMALDEIRLDIVDEAGSRLITLGLHWLRGATVLDAGAENRALWGVNESDDLQSRLTRLLYRFCRRHGVIDAKGRIGLSENENRATA
jgi:hypothetical protein